MTWYRGSRVRAQLAGRRHRLGERGAGVEPLPQAACGRAELGGDTERGLRRVLVLRPPLDCRVEQSLRRLIEAESPHAGRVQKAP